MKLINSKVYNINDVIEQGECMMCGHLLLFKESVEDLNPPFAKCCEFIYTLKDLNKIDGESYCKVEVTPNIS